MFHHEETKGNGFPEEFLLHEIPFAYTVRSPNQGSLFRQIANTVER